MCPERRAELDYIGGLFDVPQSYQPIISGGGQCLAVRAEFHRIDCLFVACDEGAKGHRRVDGEVPQFHHAGASNGEEAPVGTASDRIDCVVIPFKWVSRGELDALGP